MNKYNNKMVLESLHLPLFYDIESLAENLRLTEKLVYFLSNPEMKGKYKVYKIDKPSGNKRIISAPCESLKLVQRWILENILYKVRVSNYSYGFSKNKKGSPLLQLANKHKNSLFVLKLDLKDFYPSIKWYRVYQQFISLGYNKYASYLLTNLCTYNNELPQGAVTSAYLANMICYKMDLRIAGYCNKRDVVYTRYADDLVFSCDNRETLKKIYGMVKHIVEDEGFKLNSTKTRFMTPKVHKKVVGVTINDGVAKAPKELKRFIRSAIHHQIISGRYEQMDVLKGYISYINSIENDYKNKIISYINKFYNDPITLFPDAVDAFNSNKMFKDLPDMELKSIESFSNMGDEDLMYEMYYTEREDFLIRQGI